MSARALAVSLQVVVLASLVAMGEAAEPRCPTEAEVLRVVLFMCFYEQGFTDLESMYLYSIQLEKLCSKRTAFLGAVECQIRIARKCFPQVLSGLPSVQEDRLPVYIHGLCTAPGFNRTCYQDHNRRLRRCTSARLRQAVAMNPDKSSLCHVVVDSSSTCAQDVLQVCGDVTVDAVVKYSPYALPSRCELTPPTTPATSNDQSSPPSTHALQSSSVEPWYHEFLPQQSLGLKPQALTNDLKFADTSAGV